MFGLFDDKKKARKRLQRILAGSEPPPIRSGAMRTLRLLRDADADLSTIVESLSWDPGFVVRSLRLVNSAAFGLRNKVDSFQHAAAILGRSKLEQLVLSIAVKDSVSAKDVPGFDTVRFWRSAFFRASLARALAQKLHPMHTEASFTAGLLQDMAVPVLAQSREDYRPLLEHWHESKDVELHELERSELGFCHGEAGALLALEWELPEALANAIQIHHSNEVGDNELLPALRLVAVHRETEIEHGIEAIVSDARGLYGLDPDWLAGAIEESKETAQDLSEGV